MAVRPPAPGGSPPASPLPWLVCFAVREEAANFVAPTSTAVVVTGMGARNAARAIEVALENWRPQRVITAGFSGGLEPALKRGTVVFDSDDELGLQLRLKSLGAVPTRFHCASRIAVTASDKAQLRDETGAEVVDMESAVIRAACREAGVPSATIRVISDAANDDLPLDFNALLTSTHQINWWKFARAMAFRPTTIGRLIAFQRQTRLAAQELGRVLEAITK